MPSLARKKLDQCVQLGPLMDVSETIGAPVGPPPELRRPSDVEREHHVRHCRAERDGTLELLAAEVLPDDGAIQDSPFRPYNARATKHAVGRLLFLPIRRAPGSTLFPYTTLFRSSTTPAG